MLAGVIFKGVGDHKPYPDHGLSQRQWGELARPRCGSRNW